MAHRRQLIPKCGLESLVAPPLESEMGGYNSQLGLERGLKSLASLVTPPLESEVGGYHMKQR